MAGGSSGERSLKETPTWAVAFVCAVFVIISVLIEHGIHSLGKWFNKRQQKAMIEALEKIKAELMLLGFISLLITVGTQPISKICISAKAGQTMLPCKKMARTTSDNSKDKGDDDHPDDRRRKLLWHAGDALARRVLAAGGSKDDYCSKFKKVSLISQSAIHQLHIFIFVLAVFHVLYTVITIALAKAKLKKWKAWEEETTSLEYQFTNDPERFRFVHQTSFVRQHNSLLSKMPGIRWIVAFFRQFFASVTKVDYLTMRHGFINAHFAANTKFDFHKYIKRSMEDDFKVVFGISIPLWTFAIIFVLLNVYRWYTLFAISFVPPAMLLIVGAKLEIIIMDMAHQIQDRTTVVKGLPVVEPSNKYFWFNRPDLILGLIHFTLFQNAFQMAHFLWTWYEFGLTSCFHENLPAIVGKVLVGVACQVLNSYITFPLYALVTQMGSHMKKAIFEEQTAKALIKWQKAAREKRKLKKAVLDVPAGLISGETSGSCTPSQGSSPLHLLHKFKNNNNNLDIESITSSPRRSTRIHHSETDYSETEGPAVISSDDQRTRSPNLSPHNASEIEENYCNEFSFSKSLK